MCIMPTHHWMVEIMSLYKINKINDSNTQDLSPEILVLLSGGIDSAACVSFFLDLGRPICGLFIDYQQASVQQESKASEAIADYLGIRLFKTKWSGLSFKKDGLIVSRNAFLLTAALMEAPFSIKTIALGVHNGTAYADCSVDFIKAMQAVFNMYPEKKISISTPFIQWNKHDIYDYAFAHNVPVHLTYSCELGDCEPCGKCLSCIDREELKIGSRNLV